MSTESWYWACEGVRIQARRLLRRNRFAEEPEESCKCHRSDWRDCGVDGQRQLQETSWTSWGYPSQELPQVRKVHERLIKLQTISCFTCPICMLKLSIIMCLSHFTSLSVIFSQECIPYNLYQLSSLAILQILSANLSITKTIKKAGFTKIPMTILTVKI